MEISFSLIVIAMLVALIALPVSTYYEAKAGEPSYRVFTKIMFVVIGMAGIAVGILALIK